MGKITVFSGGRKVAEGSGAVYVPDGQAVTTDASVLRFSRRVRWSDLRRIMRKYGPGKRRLPRKLKKALRHIDVTYSGDGEPIVETRGFMTITMAMYPHVRIRTVPDGYGETRWTLRARRLAKAELRRACRTVIAEEMRATPPTLPEGGLKFSFCGDPSGVNLDFDHKQTKEE